MLCHDTGEMLVARWRVGIRYERGLNPSSCSSSFPQFHSVKLRNDSEVNNCYVEGVTNRESLRDQNCALSINQIWEPMQIHGLKISKSN